MSTDAVAQPALAEYSRFVQRVRRRYAADLSALQPGLPSAAQITQLVQQLQAGGRDLPAALRVARQLVVERLACLDIEQGAPLDDICSTVTSLAEATLELALAQALAEADERHGRPLNAQGQAIAFWIIGMGKLGARELNVSSDIDLVYVYEDDGHTAGARAVSAHEYFTFVAKRLFALIGETTDDGLVFRVDLALRPNGNSGPPVVSLAMLEEYFQVQGREWERFAWLKSRVVAPRADVVSGRALALRSLVTPFVYRRYLDYGIFESLRQLHRKIRDEAQRRAAGRPERANDVKLSRGGIREIEFIVQLMLVVRGGQYPEIRTRSTLRGLQRLVASGLMKPEAAQTLAAGYCFLRRVEHRIQYLDDQQTHLLPMHDDDLRWIGRSLHGTLAQGGLEPGADAGGHAGGDAGGDASGDEVGGADNTAGLARDATPGRESCLLLTRLLDVREAVAAEFDALLSEGRSSADGGGEGRGEGDSDSDGAETAAGAGADNRADQRKSCRSCSPGPLAIDSEALLDKLPAELASRVRIWVQQPRVQALRDESRLRLGRLMSRTALVMASGTCSTPAALRFVDWVDALLRRDSYLALLLERPDVHRRLLHLLGTARWTVQYLMRHPGVIDELADDRLLHQRFDRAAFTAELDDRRDAWQRAGQADEEQLLDTLRRAHHAEVFRTLVRDVEGELSVEEVADDLSALADTVLAAAVRWCWPLLKQRHRETPSLAVIAYGKLGGKELGYGGDLDVVFLFDDADEGLPGNAAGQNLGQHSAQEIYGAFVRKLITWLTLRTAAGELFDIDTALRPNGNSGLLVTSIGAFENYQRGRGSNTAWTWEHQALTRARCAAGPAAVALRFEATRRSVLTATRDPAALREEVRAMREKVRRARPVPAGRFDVKHSPGGMMDVEFAVQSLVLTHGAAHAALLDNAGNIALLQRAETAGLLPAGVGQAAAGAYRTLRSAQHQARLDEQPTQFDPAQLAQARDAVLALWQVVFP